jgi:HEAT repeat protein
MLTKRITSIGLLVCLALSAWACSNDSPGEHPLVERFEEPQYFFQQFDVAVAIVAARDRGVLPELEEWLRNEDRHVRANAAYVFAGFGDDRGLDTLFQILDDRTDRPLGQGITDLSFNPNADGWWIPSQIKADRYYAVHVLAGLRDGRTLGALLPLLDDPDVNYKVAWALGEIGDPRAIPGLIDALRDPNAVVRAISIQSLVQLRAIEAIPYIESLLADSSVPSADIRVPISETAQVALDSLISQDDQ